MNEMARLPSWDPLPKELEPKLRQDLLYIAEMAIVAQQQVDAQYDGMFAVSRLELIIDRAKDTHTWLKREIEERLEKEANA